jgi:hypothetical protein
VIVRVACSYQTSISTFTPFLVGRAMRPDDTAEQRALTS